MKAALTSYVNRHLPINHLKRELLISIFKMLPSQRRSRSDSAVPVNNGQFLAFSVTILHDFMQFCAIRKYFRGGKSCHSLAFQFGLISDITTCNILISLYSKCDELGHARQMFDGMSIRSSVSWNTMIAALNHRGEHLEALMLFVEMFREDIAFTEFTLSSVLCACAKKSALVESKQLHAVALKVAAMYSNVYVGTAVLDVYAKCGIIEDASLVFEEVCEKSDVTWSSMLSGYIQNNLFEESLLLFRKSRSMGVEISQFSLSSVLSACASLAAVVEGTQLHSLLLKARFDSDIYVATSLIDVYSKCGQIEEAYAVFRDSELKSIVLWNAIIAGFSRHACMFEVMVLFEKMQQSGLSPNEVTYVSVLSVCGHFGSVENGRWYYNMMLSDENIEPNVLHYSCMVDVLGRGGNIDEAWKLIETMPFNATASIWGSLLASCRIHGYVKLAEEAARRLFVMEPENGGSHVLLSNIYASRKQWNEVAIARKVMKDSGAKKELGKSWIEVDKKVHTFVVGERNHPKILEIYRKLEEVEKELSAVKYGVDTQHDLHDVGADQKVEL